MALVVDQLQLWTVGFKWAGLDPERFWLVIPEVVRDNIRTLLEAILNEHLDCATLFSEKYDGDDPEIAPFYLRYWIDDIYAAVQGHSLNRKLLRHAIIERSAFRDWCERRTIPLPEFWFPTGWSDYRWPSEDFEPVPAAPVSVIPGEPCTSNSHGPMVATQAPAPVSEETETGTKLRPVQLAKILSQQIATVIWKEDPSKTIAAMVKDDRVQKYGGAQYYADETVRRWMQEKAPQEVSAKRGRPKKKTPTEGN